LALALAAGVASAALALGFRRNARAADDTWACGYAAVGARMQYTALALSELLTSRVLPRALAPSVGAPALHDFAPAPVELRTSHDEPLLADQPSSRLASACAACCGNLPSSRTSWWRSRRSPGFAARRARGDSALTSPELC
jgi:hypothetical protein